MRFIGTSSNTDRSYENVIQGLGDLNSSTSIFFLSVCILSSLFTVFSNLITAIILIRSRNGSSISNLFIISLSIVDMFIGLTMLLLFTYILLISSSSWRSPLPWLCDAWQVTDFVLSTVSLYSICAIALDRILNLEKPLHVFKRSRRLAVKLIFCIWIIPVLIWLPFYLTLTKSSRNSIETVSGITCTTGYNKPMLILIVSLFVFYIPSVLLVVMFARISVVVHRHFAFLKKHSSNPKVCSPSPVFERKGSVQTLSPKKESTHSECGGLRVRQSQFLEVNSEERLPLCGKTYKSYSEITGSERILRRKSFQGTTRPSQQQLSISRSNSIRLSIIAFPSHVKELLQKECISRQIRAARAVSLILSCFLLCWLPFLVMWPVKLYCRSCISDWIYAVAVFLNYLCSALNPLLYALSSPRVRVQIMSKFECSPCRWFTSSNV